MSDDTTLDEFAVDSEESNESDMVAESKQTTDDLQTLETSPIENWELLRLGKVLSFEYGDNLPADTRQDGDIPVYGSNGQIDTHTEANVDRAGIIIGRKGSIGEGEFSNEPFWAIDTTYYISSEETDENLRFIHYLLQDMELERLNAASAIPGLNRNDAYNLNTLVPPLSEQRKIATVLHTVDQAIQKTEDVIRSLQRILRGTRRDVMKNGIHTHQMSDSDSRFGDVPEVWDIERLDSVTDVTGGSTPSTDESKYWSGEIPWATPTDLTGLDEIKIRDTESHITEEGLNSTSTNLLPPESVLMTSRATIGECAVNTAEMATNQGFQSLVPDKSVDTWYLYYRMQEEANYLNSLGSGSTFSEVSNTTVQRVKIPIPPIEEQEQIADILKSIDEARIQEEEYKTQLQQLKQGLMQDLLSGTVRTADADVEVPDKIEQYG